MDSFNWQTDYIFQVEAYLCWICNNIKVSKNLIWNLKTAHLCVSQNLDKAIWSHLVPVLAHLVPDPVIPCTRPWYTLYHALSHLIPDLFTPCTREWSHLVPDPATSCTKPSNTLYQTLSHLAPDLVTPCTRPWHTL